LCYSLPEANQVITELPDNTKEPSLCATSVLCASDQILLEAKIICLADVVEAMASHRPYRPARGIDAALEEIKRQRGILFDEDVVDACLRLFREKGFQLG